MKEKYNELLDKINSGRIKIHYKLNELVEINTVAKQLAKRYALVPMLQDEPVGVERLHELASG